MIQKTHSYALLFLCAAILIHGVWGTPTPDEAGFPEIIIGSLLILAAGVAPTYDLLRHISRTNWIRSGQYLFFYGLSVPLITGLIAGNSPSLILRDVIPFLFILTPLFFRTLLQEIAVGRGRLALTGAVMVAGWLFAARVVVPLWWHSHDNVLKTLAPADPFYLANAPTVFFAAAILLSGAGLILYKGLSARNIVISGVLAVLSLIPLTAMMLVEQRASAGLMVMICVILCAVGLAKKPVRIAPVIVILCLAVMASWGVISHVGAILTEKTNEVGLNSRAQEAAAVIKSVWASPLTVIFGRGWGATFESPAVGGVLVNFTHNFLTTYLLKTGLCGMVLAALYMARLGVRLWPLLWRFPVVALALAAPLAIDVTLYASFKSLDFGFLLLLIPLWTAVPLLHPRPSYSMQEQSQDQIE